MANVCPCHCETRHNDSLQRTNPIAFCERVPLFVTEQLHACNAVPIKGIEAFFDGVEILEYLLPVMKP